MLYSFEVGGTQVTLQIRTLDHKGENALRFCVDQQLLVRARHILTNRSKVYWIIGGAGAGKSTVCRAIANDHGIPVYDMDAHVFEDYPQRCSRQRHPATSAHQIVSWLGIDQTSPEPEHPR